MKTFKDFLKEGHDVWNRTPETVAKKQKEIAARKAESQRLAGKQITINDKKSPHHGKTGTIRSFDGSTYVVSMAPKTPWAYVKKEHGKVHD